MLARLSGCALNRRSATDGRITELHLWAVREGLARRPALWNG